MLPNLFDFGAWATHERRPGIVVTGLQIEQTIKRLSTEAGTQHPSYKRKQSLSWTERARGGTHACWYDGVAVTYRIFRVDDDGFVMISKHLDDDGGTDHFERA